MPKVIFFFAGTGRTAKEYKAEHDTFLAFPDDVTRIYVNGCQDPAVGGGHSVIGGFDAMISADLDVGAKNIRSAFTKKDLNLDTLQKNFGHRLIIEPAQGQENPILKNIDSIGLEGYSRGAVETFVVAKTLDDLGILIDIVANQPVTGESKQYVETKKKKKTLFSKHQSMTDCSHIRSATVLYATHENQLNMVYDHYFMGMKPTFSNTTNSTNILLPQQRHKRSSAYDKETLRKKGLVSTPAPYHIAKALAPHGYAYVNNEKYDEMTKKIIEEKDSSDLNNTPIQKAELCAKAWYLTEQYYFTPFLFAQKLHGASRNELSESKEYWNLKINQANRVLIKTTGITHQFKELTDDDISNSDSKKFKNATRAIALLCIENTIKDNSDKRNMLLFITDNDNEKDDQINQFCAMVKNVHDGCEHLHLRTDIKGSKKAHLIEQKSQEYQAQVFTACFHYLNPIVKSDGHQEKATLEKTLLEAEKSFITNAELSKDRRTPSIIRYIGQFILSTISSLRSGATNNNSATEKNIVQFKQRKQELLAVRSVKITQKITDEMITVLTAPIIK